MGDIVRRVMATVGRYPPRIADGISMYWPKVFTFLRRHPLLILGPLVLLAIAVILWGPPWPRAAFVILQQHLFVMVVGTLGLGLLSFVLWRIPKSQIADAQDLKDRLTLENAARQSLAPIIGGAVLIVGLFLTWENLKITQETATNNLEMARRGQITDRFTEAIAQLGDPMIAVQLVASMPWNELPKIRKETTGRLWKS
jgi:hypothetical protein